MSPTVSRARYLGAAFQRQRRAARLAQFNADLRRRELVDPDAPMQIRAGATPKPTAPTDWVSIATWFFCALYTGVVFYAAFEVVRGLRGH